MKPTCPDCKSKQILFGKRLNSYWCRVCGYQWERIEKEGNKNDKKDHFIN